MTLEQEKEYRKKCVLRREELLDKLILNPGLSRMEKDIIELEYMELEIMPGSRAWRCGRKGVLRRARKALERQMKEERI